MDLRLYYHYAKPFDMRYYKSLSAGIVRIVF